MNNNTFNTFLKEWHASVLTSDEKKLNDLIDEDCVFHSPVVWKPQEGKFLTYMYLLAASKTLNQEFEYTKKVIQGLNGVLEFRCKIEEVIVEGVDIIEINEAGKITSFKVMVRPLKAVHKIHEMMGKMLETMKN